jgi:NAD-reducing hydrogenase large subunit
MSNEQTMKKLVIEPVTRVEGHGKVTILMNAKHEVEQARLHIVEFRGFERFIQGRPYWEVPVLVQRLCGICPVSHHLAAAKAMDLIAGVEQLTPTAEKMRRLMHYGQMFQSHVLHFFHLVSPDLLFGFSADPVIRNVIGVAAKFKDLAVQGVMMRKYGQELIKATAGKKIHGTGAVPGGINRCLTKAERDGFLKDIDQMTAWSLGALKVAKDYSVDNLALVAKFGSFPSSYMSLVRKDGAMDLYDGTLRAVDNDGKTLFDQVPVADYGKVLTEEVRPWSYMKFPFLTQVEKKDSEYRVGPLARINACTYIDTPLAEAARKEFMAVNNGKPLQHSLAYHWARMIEVVHSIEKIKQLLEDPDILKDDRMAKGKRRREAVGIIEAPRGTLIHHYRVGDDDLVEMANLIVSTTHNNIGMNKAVTDVAKTYLTGKEEVTEGLLNHIEVAIRCYDPCLSCATHAMGQMQLDVSIVGPDGTVLDRKLRG